MTVGKKGLWEGSQPICRRFTSCGRSGMVRQSWLSIKFAGTKSSHQHFWSTINLLRWLKCKFISTLHHVGGVFLFQWSLDLIYSQTIEIASENCNRTRKWICVVMVKIEGKKVITTWGSKLANISAEKRNEKYPKYQVIIEAWCYTQHIQFLWISSAEHAVTNVLQMALRKLKYTAFTVGKTSEKHSERACDMLPVILYVHVSHQQFPAVQRNFSVSNFIGILSCFLSLLLLYYYWAMQPSRRPTLVPSESSQRYSGD